MVIIKKKKGSVNSKFAKDLIFVNKGIPGDTSTGLLHRINKDLLNFKPKPDYSIIIIGSNDLGWGLKSDNVLENIKILHEISRENRIMSIGGLIPPITKRSSSPRWDITHSDFNEELKQCFIEKEIPCTDYGYMTDNDDYLKQEYTSGDGINFQ